ncbi:uncharacterized protein K452DRAFT_309262 [Aplosporella prunicola CBS 121167]|uniref:Uncharacterized protein n=1 Tax=Aplosporella prunicola CBS 121167 TaxID=1176127 RepID=A0A6A6BDY8_9PEZI|nr:uncharacterized protein K452DRAFT_309262 [Aplosporella prunicola CBS 121167]KAF2141515.1 hypothetical protein K452DRAFT_309262 [Aplosporella prunicola CBS 121167]
MYKNGEPIAFQRRNYIRAETFINITLSLLETGGPPITLEQRLALTDSKISLVFPQHKIEFVTSRCEVSTGNQLRHFIDGKILRLDLLSGLGTQWRIFDVNGMVIDLSKWNASNSAAATYTIKILPPEDRLYGIPTAPLKPEEMLHIPDTHTCITAIVQKTEGTKKKKRTIQSRSKFIVPSEATVTELWLRLGEYLGCNITRLFVQQPGIEDRCSETPPSRIFRYDSKRIFELSSNSVLHLLVDIGFGIQGM